MTEQEARSICDGIRQVAYELHVYLGTGYLEKVYESGLAHRLEKAGFDVKTQIPIKISDEDGFILGEYVADMMVSGILVELKAVANLIPIHVSQLLNYLTATGIKHGMLVNFGSEKFQCQKIASRH